MIRYLDAIFSHSIFSCFYSNISLIDRLFASRNVRILSLIWNTDVILRIFPRYTYPKWLSILGTGKVVANDTRLRAGRDEVYILPTRSKERRTKGPEARAGWPNTIRTSRCWEMLDRNDPAEFTAVGVRGRVRRIATKRIVVRIATDSIRSGAGLWPRRRYGWTGKKERKNENRKEEDEKSWTEREE